MRLPLSRKQRQIKRGINIYKLMYDKQFKQNGTERIRKDSSTKEKKESKMIYYAKK